MSLGGLYMEGLIFGILRYVSFPMWIHTPCTTYSIISFYCHSQLQHLTSAGVNRSFKPYSNAGFSSRQRKFWSSRRRKKLMSQAQLASAKRASYQGAWGHASWKNLEIWAFQRAIPAFWSKTQCLNRTQTLNFGFWRGGISKGKQAASSREIASEFRQPPALVENPANEHDSVKQAGDK